METVTLDGRETLIYSILVLFLGRFLNSKINFLQKYNIPEPVSGGVTASLIFCIIYLLFDITIIFDLELRDSFLIIFFTTIGLTSHFKTLVKGGKGLVVMLALAILYLFIQNLTGIFAAVATGTNPYIGLIGGSVSLSGGHGTTIAWSEIFATTYGISNAMEIGVACATFGLVLGGLIGGPIAKHLITKYDLKSNNQATLSVGAKDEQSKVITVDAMFKTILMIAIAMGIGIEIQDILKINLPLFVTCLFGGIVFTNIILPFFSDNPLLNQTSAIALVSELCLGLFLSMSLMSLQLWTLIDLALPILIMLGAQVIILIVFVLFFVFPALGKDYDAAVISAGYSGLALGATPTAIANMTAVSKRFGAAPKAFIIIPLVGAFFIDISNALIINIILGWLA